MCGSATRNTGVLMLAVLAFMYAYGPRADAPPGPPRGRLRLRYPIRPDVAWLALVPLGLVAYLVYLGIRFDDPFVTFSAQSHFHRSFDGPLSAVWQGAHQAFDSVGDLLAGRARGEAGRAMAVFGVVAAGLVAAVGVLRRLPAAYGVYTVLGLLPALSFPQEGHPLASASRYLLVLFPLFMWLGMRLTDRRAYVATLVVFAIGLAYAAGTFATWRFVA
jgi:type IV secretory pathway VirB2 component (pilin)